MPGDCSAQIKRLCQGREIKEASNIKVAICDGCGTRYIVLFDEAGQAFAFAGLEAMDVKEFVETIRDSVGSGVIVN